MIVIKMIVGIGLATLLVTVLIIAACVPAYIIVRFLFWMTDGKEGVDRYDKMIDKEISKFEKEK